MTDSGHFNVGYFNKHEYRMDSQVYYNIILNYNEDGSGIEVNDSEIYMDIVNTTPEDRYYSRESGIVYVNASSLRGYIAGLDFSVETVSLVCWVLDVSDVNVDEDGNPVENWIAHAITLDMSEFNELN